MTCFLVSLQKISFNKKYYKMQTDGLCMSCKTRRLVRATNRPVSLVNYKRDVLSTTFIIQVVKGAVLYTLYAVCKWNLHAYFSSTLCRSCEFSVMLFATFSLSSGTITGCSLRL